MKPKKKRSGPFLCFGAPDPDEKIERRKRFTVSISDSAPPPPGSEESECEPELLRCGRRRHGRILDKIIRSVALVSNTSDRRGRLPEDPSRSLARKASDASDDRSALESSGKSSDDDYRRADSIFSSSSSSSLSSASSSSFRVPEPKLRPKRTIPRAETKTPTPVPRNYGYATGLFLLLLSLSVTVLCGRLCAILCTSTWLCLIPRRNPGTKLLEYDMAVVDPPELRSKGCMEQEKRRVVMEGLLERNRRVEKKF